MSAYLILGPESAERRRPQSLNIETLCPGLSAACRLQRNLLYTGVTRGKRLVVLVGQKKAIAIAVRNVSGRRRCSKLAEWLAPGSAN